MKKSLIFGVVAAATALSYAAFNANSGLNVGEMVTPFHPKHISGPDKGTDTCPPCKYGSRPAVQAWMSPSEKPDTVMAIAKTLSANVEAHKAAELKGFMIMLTMCQACEGKAGKFAEAAKIENLGIATLSTGDKAVQNYKVSTEKDVKNTVFVYKNKKVVAKFVNLTDSKDDLAKLEAAIASAAK
jgi:protocatechuate 3,4-dioxygenase beta subunit